MAFRVKRGCLLSCTSHMPTHTFFFFFFWAAGFVYITAMRPMGQHSWEFPAQGLPATERGEHTASLLGHEEHCALGLGAVCSLFRFTLSCCLGMVQAGGLLDRSLCTYMLDRERGRNLDFRVHTYILLEGSMNIQNM